MAIILPLYRIKVNYRKTLFDIFPEFHSTKKGLPLVDAWSRDLDKIHIMYPDGDAKNQAVVSRSGYNST